MTTVSITLQKQRDPLTIDPFTGEVMETLSPLLHTSKGSRYTGHGQHLITIDQHIIRMVMSNCYKRINDPGLGESKTRIPYYYRLLYEYGQKCIRTGNKIDALVCHKCIDLIPEGSIALSASRRRGRKYYHVNCGKALNLI